MPSPPFYPPELNAVNNMGVRASRNFSAGKCVSILVYFDKVGLCHMHRSRLKRLRCPGHHSLEAGGRGRLLPDASSATGFHWVLLSLLIWQVRTDVPVTFIC